MNPILNIPQAKFLTMPHKFRAYVAGYGSGKTWAGSAGICKHFWEFPKVNAGYFAPSYPQIRDIFYPTIEEVAHDWGMRVEIREGNKEVHFYNGRTSRGTVICRSMDNPNSIVGFKIGHALADEIDTINKIKATQVWRRMIARMRDGTPGLRNGIDVTTTPEGFGFAYDQFVKQIRDKPDLNNFYGIIHASTYDNEKNLPADYIPSLVQSYPENLIKAYLNGQFVNLNSGTVYSSFDRKLNHSDRTIKEGDVLHIGMDFNVLNMASVIYVLDDEKITAVDEITEGRDTPTMAQLIKERYPSHSIRIYPDASGQNKSSKNASESDLLILRQHGFSLMVDSANPAVKDRVNATNAMLCNAKGERRMFVNTNRCIKFTEGLEQQAYNSNGEPDKSAGVDHVNDAGTYPIVKLFPIRRPKTKIQTAFSIY